MLTNAPAHAVGAALSGEIELRYGDHIVRVAPGAGGIITLFATQRDNTLMHWMRPSPPEAVEQRDFLQSSSFPLVPWCNRIEGGTALFEGVRLNLEADPGFPHPLHGLGRKREWDTEVVDATSVTMSFAHLGGAWPWAFRATQRLSLDSDGLQIDLTVENNHSGPMPVGIGHHPYFVCNDKTVLTATVEQRWLSNDELLPQVLVGDALADALKAGVRAGDIVADAVFSGWNRSASLRYPDRGASLEISGDERFPFLHLYRAVGGDFICVEPVSNVTNWLNLDADISAIGGHVLDPGETLTGSCRFNPTFQSALSG
jgi:aldose 1-epimerase